MGLTLFADRGIALKTTGLREQIVDALSGGDDIEFAFVFGSEASNTSGAKSDESLLLVGEVGLRALAPASALSFPA